MFSAGLCIDPPLVDIHPFHMRSITVRAEIRGYSVPTYSRWDHTKPPHPLAPGDRRLLVEEASGRFAADVATGASRGHENASSPWRGDVSTGRYGPCLEESDDVALSYHCVRHRSWLLAPSSHASAGTWPAGPTSRTRREHTLRLGSVPPVSRLPCSAITKEPHRATQRAQVELTKELKGVLTRLGPGYIKLGQAMAVRPDLFSEEAMAVLQVPAEGKYTLPAQHAV